MTLRLHFLAALSGCFYTFEFSEMKIGLPGFSLFIFFSPAQVSPAGVGKPLEGFSRDSCRCVSATRRERKASSWEEVHVDVFIGSPASSWKKTFAFIYPPSP